MSTRRLGASLVSKTPRLWNCRFHDEPDIGANDPLVVDLHGTLVKAVPERICFSAILRSSGLFIQEISGAASFNACICIR